MKNFFYLLSVCSFLLVGCENNDLLQSEKKIHEELENKTWKRVAPSPEANYHETWFFKDGAVTIIKDKNENGIADTTDNDMFIHATYSIDTKVSSSYVSLMGIPLDSRLYGYEMVNMNYKWTVAEINADVLYLSTATESGTIRSLEFVKIGG